MPTITIDFEESFRHQRELAAEALDRLHDLAVLLRQLLPGEDPDTGQLREDIEEGLTHLGQLEALIKEQWFRNRPD